VGISGSPCYTPCHALLGLPKHLVIGLDQVVMLGFSSFLGYMTGASGLWDIGYGIWEILPSLWSLGTPWVCHVVCIRAKNPVVVLLRHRSDLRVICCNPSYWSFGSQPFESKRLCDAAQEGIICHCNHSTCNTFNPLGQPRCRGPPSSSAAVWTI